MIEVKKEYTAYNTIYQAVDGTEFNNREECEKYEASARGVIRKKLQELVIDSSYTEYSLFDAGSDDYSLLLVKMNTIEDRDIILQAFYIDNPWVLETTNGSDRWKERAYKIVTKAYEEKDILVLGLNCDDDLYIVTTRNTIIERLNNLDKPKEISDEKD